jgi:hypothetical protein
MKFIVVIALILAVVAAQVADPDTSGCKAGAKCSARGEICDAFGQMFYCLNADYCAGANFTTNGTCAARIPENGDCSGSKIAGCELGLLCTADKCVKPTAGPTTTLPPLVYEGAACDTTGPYCGNTGLTCVDKKCHKAFTGAADDACVSDIDCGLGHGCDNSKCKKYTKAIGDACAKNADCDGGAKCWCTAKDSKTQGSCAGNLPMSCQKAVDAWIAVGKIDSATKGNTEQTCVESCYTNYMGENWLKPFAGYNRINDATACTYTVPATCVPTTPAPTTASSGYSFRL